MCEGSETAAGYASKDGCERKLCSRRLAPAQRATANAYRATRIWPIGLSSAASFSSSEEGTRKNSLALLHEQPRIVLQPRRASPTNRNLNLRSRCRGIEPRAPRARQLPADTRRFRRRRRNLDFDFCGERQPRQPRSPHSLSSSPLCHSRVFVTSFVTSTFHCRNVAPPFAERGARRNNLPPCPIQYIKIETT